MKDQNRSEHVDEIRIREVFAEHIKALLSKDSNFLACAQTVVAD